MNISQLPFTQQMQVHESHVRGVYISIACDYEQLMDDVIYLCELETGPLTLTDEIISHKLRYICHLEMGKKFRRTKEGLKNYNIQYFQDFTPHLDIIEKLVKYRTILAHGYSSYDEHQKDKSFIDFKYFYKGKEHTERIIIYPFLTKMEQYRSSIMELAGLTVLLRKERGLL